jgi:hypothetical protein
MHRVPEVGFEPTRPCEQRILSPSCLPFHHSGKIRALHHATRYHYSVVSFVVGIVVGASVAALLLVIFAPSRRVRAEKPLDRDVETKLLLGRDPDDPTYPPPASPDQPRMYSSSELAQLRRLGEAQKRRRTQS